jgi:hypothetical protein
VVGTYGTISSSKRTGLYGCPLDAQTPANGVICIVWFPPKTDISYDLMIEIAFEKSSALNQGAVRLFAAQVPAKVYLHSRRRGNPSPDLSVGVMVRLG